MNPFSLLLIVGMAFCFIVVMSLVLLVRRVLLHFIDSRESDDQFGK